MDNLIKISELTNKILTINFIYKILKVNNQEDFNRIAFSISQPKLPRTLEILPEIMKHDITNKLQELDSIFKMIKSVYIQQDSEKYLISNIKKAYGFEEDEMTLIPFFYSYSDYITKVNQYIKAHKMNQGGSNYDACSCIPLTLILTKPSDKVLNDINTYMNAKITKFNEIDYIVTDTIVTWNELVKLTYDKGLNDHIHLIKLMMETYNIHY